MSINISREGCYEGLVSHRDNENNTSRVSRMATCPPWADGMHPPQLQLCFLWFQLFCEALLDYPPQPGWADSELSPCPICSSCSCNETIWGELESVSGPGQSDWKESVNKLLHSWSAVSTIPWFHPRLSEPCPGHWPSWSPWGGQHWPHPLWWTPPTLQSLSLASSLQGCLDDAYLEALGVLV